MMYFESLLIFIPIILALLSLTAIIVSIFAIRISRREQKLSRLEAIRKNRRDFFDFYKERFIEINSQVNKLIDSIPSDAYTAELKIINRLDEFGRDINKKAFRHLVNDIILYYCDALLPSITTENGFWGSKRITDVYQIQFLHEDYKHKIPVNSLSIQSLYSSGKRGSIVNSLLKSEGFHKLIKEYFDSVREPTECYEFIYQTCLEIIKNLSRIRPELNHFKLELENLIERNEIEDINLSENEIIYQKIYSLKNKLDFLDNLSTVEYRIKEEIRRNDKGDKYTSSAIIMALIYLSILSSYKHWGRSPTANTI